MRLVLALGFGSVMYVLVFLFECFVNIYAGGVHRDLYVNAVWFLLLYWLLAYVAVRMKRCGRLFLYIILPFLLSCAISAVYSSFFVMNEHWVYLLIYYLVAGYWFAGICAGLADLVLTFFIKKSRKLRAESNPA